MSELIEEGLSIVRSDRRHNLNLEFRCRLRAFLDRAYGLMSRRKRTTLAALAVRKVLPMWDLFFVNDKAPHEALRFADDVLAGLASSKEAESVMGGLWSHCDDLAWKYGDKQNVIMVGYGASQVVREALSDKRFGCDRLQHISTDSKADPYDHDASFCSAIAYSGGAPSDERSDVQKRLEFWTWWLMNAVPTAEKAV